MSPRPLSPFLHLTSNNHPGTCFRYRCSTHGRVVGGATGAGADGLDDDGMSGYMGYVGAVVDATVDDVDDVLGDIVEVLAGTDVAAVVAGLDGRDELGDDATDPAGAESAGASVDGTDEELSGAEVDVSETVVVVSSGASVSDVAEVGGGGMSSLESSPQPTDTTETSAIAITNTPNDRVLVDISTPFTPSKTLDPRCSGSKKQRLASEYRPRTPRESPVQRGDRADPQDFSEIPDEKCEDSTAHGSCPVCSNGLHTNTQGQPP